jgi:hypothetical protein
MSRISEEKIQEWGYGSTEAISPDRKFRMVLDSIWTTAHEANNRCVRLRGMGKDAQYVELHKRGRGNYMVCFERHRGLPSWKAVGATRRTTYEKPKKPLLGEFGVKKPKPAKRKIRR